MKRTILLVLVLVLVLAGCSNLVLQCSGTYTGDEVRDVRK